MRFDIAKTPFVVLVLVVGLLGGHVAATPVPEAPVEDGQCSRIMSVPAMSLLFIQWVVPLAMSVLIRVGQ